MTKVAVLKGGRSAERKVSLTTGGAVAEGLRAGGHEVVEIDVDVDVAEKLAQTAPDAVFLALHGRWGEDGTVQGLLEMMGLPYTGSGVTASAVAMDKVLSKVIFRAHEVITPDFQVLGPAQGAGDIKLEPPYVIKPPKEGSTIGITVVNDPSEAAAAIDIARGFGKEVLVEKFVDGRELTVGVLDGEVLPVVEIEPESGFYDFESKYTAGATRYTCPAELSGVQTAMVQAAGLAAYKALGCDGAARVDVLLGKDGVGQVIEVNTIPGMTPTSLLPKAAAAAGMDFETLVDRMLGSASLKA